MLKIKAGVQPRSLVIAAALINAALEHGLAADMVITAGRNGRHKPGSKHYTDEALDFRTQQLAPADKAALVASMQSRLGPAYQVFLEAVGTQNEHGHAEHDPA